jgi:lipoprotein NlpI
LPWALAGLAMGALITVVGLRLVGGTAATSPQTASPPIGTAGPGMAPDISRMSPEERATRLYNRVMTLHAAGKSDSAEFFLPMALQAYAMLPALDIDAHYHMGVLRLTGGDAAGALAEADSIRRLAATHLFGFVLRAQALELQHDSRRAQQAYRDFLKYEAAERARGLPEYVDHAQNLDSFHTRAVEATKGK